MVWSLSWHIVISWLEENIRCTCLNYVVDVLVKISPIFQSVGLSYPKTVNLSSVAPLQIYLLCGELANTFFTDPESIARRVEPVDIFGDPLLRAGYDPCDSVDFHGRADFVEKLSNSYKTVRVASDVDTSSMSTFLQSPGKLVMQLRTASRAQN